MYPRAGRSVILEGMKRYDINVDGEVVTLRFVHGLLSVELYDGMKTYTEDPNDAGKPYEERVFYMLDTALGSEEDQLDRAVYKWVEARGTEARLV